MTRIPLRMVAGLIILLGVLLVLVGAAEKSAVLLQDEFAGPSLDAARWQPTQQGDVQAALAEVKDGRLRLRLATMGTRDDTVKYLGVRTKQALDFSRGIEIAYDLDWNNQANGCYLTAGISLCPTATDGNPLAERDWVKVDYIGVPPGRNARLLVAVKRGDREQHLYTEGWPAEQRTGRKIGLQHMRLILYPDRLEVWENEKVLLNTPFRDADTIAHPLTWSQGYLYLQMSSHSNYRAREILFDNVKVSPAPANTTP